MPDPIASSLARTTSDPALIAAWRRFLDYDIASSAQKIHHGKIRTAIIILSFAASALAVAISTKDSNPIIAVIAEPLRFILILLPITSAGLLTYASNFAPSLTWLAYRIGAELTRREIYLYRMQAGDYADPKRLSAFPGSMAEQQQQLLLVQVEAANRRVNRIGVPDPYLQTAVNDIPKCVADKHKTSNPADDGFAALTPEEYIKYRVMPQMDWYITKSHRDYDLTRRWRTYLLIISGVSAALAALNFAPFVAVTTALGVALTTYMDLRMMGRNYPIYHPVANSLEIELDRWRILTPEQQTEPAQISIMVKHIEDLFQSESDQWSQQAIQAQQAIEQSLSKSAGSQQQALSAAAQSTTTTAVTVSTPDSSGTGVSVTTQTSGDGSATSQTDTSMTVAAAGTTSGSNGSAQPDTSAGAAATSGAPASTDTTQPPAVVVTTSTSSASDDQTAPVVTNVTVNMTPAAGTTGSDSSTSSSPQPAVTTDSTVASTVPSTTIDTSSPAVSPVPVLASANGGTNGASGKHPADNGDGSAG